MRYLRLQPSRQEDNTQAPVVFLHGLLGYSFSWRHNLEVFARNRTVYAVDLLGMGYSDRPEPGDISYSLSDTAERMMAWMRSLSLYSADMVATSHGGALAMRMAMMNRQAGASLLRRLVLVAAANPFSNAGSGRIRFFSRPFGAWMLRHGMVLQAASRWLGIRRMYGDPSRVTRETLDGYAGVLTEPHTADYALGIIANWKNDMEYLRGRFSRMEEMPTLLLWGSLDRTVPVASAVELQKHLPNSRLTIIEGSGHLPYEESPEEFNREVLGFLDSELPGRETVQKSTGATEDSI